MKKSSYGLITAGSLLALLIASQMDQKLFDKESEASAIKKKADEFLEKMNASRSSLKKIIAEKDLEQFRMEDPNIALEAEKLAVVEDVVEEPVVPERTITLRVSGIMQTSEGVIMGTVDGSLVWKGDMVRGCEVLDVTTSGITFDVFGENVFVPVNGTYTFEPQQSRGLTLQRIENRNGQNFAVVDERFFKAGDWVDADTQVKAVTPTMVMFSFEGESVILKEGESR